MTKNIQVFSSVERKEDAEAIARAVVEQRLAACVQILGPMVSTYWWKGKIETAQEWLCLIKSHAGVYPALEAAIKAVHPYENPEIIATPIVAGSRAYLSWLADETSSAESSSRNAT